jgi:hypothetical protein
VDRAGKRASSSDFKYGQRHESCEDAGSHGYNALSCVEAAATRSTNFSEVSEIDYMAGGSL